MKEKDKDVHSILRDWVVFFEDIGHRGIKYYTLQKSAMLGTATILRKILQLPIHVFVHVFVINFNNKM